MITHYGGTSWELLTDAFLVGAGNNYNVNATGGANNVTLTESNLPSHSHTYYRSNTSTGSHTLTVSEIPSHNHTQAYDNSGGYLPSGGIAHSITNHTNNTAFSDRSADYYNNNLLSDTGGGGGHTHTITRTSVLSGFTGSGTAFSILPTYIAVYMWRRTA